MNVIAPMRALFAGAALLMLTAVSAMGQQYPTIVGEWYAEKTPQDCGTPFAVKIGAMHYVEDELSCSFDDVARDGWQVTWNGSCNSGNEPTKVHVVATEDRGRLVVTINGNPGWTALRRCTAR